MDTDTFFDMIRFGLFAKPREPSYYACVVRTEPLRAECKKTVETDGAIKVPGSVYPKNHGKWLADALKIRVEIS